MKFVPKCSAHLWR